VYLCYIDESGTSAIPGNSSHFVLAGLSIPIRYWKVCESDIDRIKAKYLLTNKEIHIAWILRKYIEQNKIPDFSTSNYIQRRSNVEHLRTIELLRLQKSKNKESYHQTKKNYKQTADYIHLSLQERQQFISEIAQCISQWGFARLFAECVDKTYFDPSKTTKSIDEQSFEQIVSRFEQYLQIIGKNDPESCCGLLIHDNNETVARKHTNMMRLFHHQGTMWTTIKNIIETPLFVDSQLTSMVQIADVCSYSIRRYLENGENTLFDLIFQRADRKDGMVVGVRHYTSQNCNCKICGPRKKIMSVQPTLPLPLH
jgi:hypothetical protein